jgi:uncharacterized protein (DUF58 family)
MSFGTAAADKRAVMIYAAACLAFSAAADQVNFGVLAFGRDIIDYWPPHRSRGRAWRAIDDVWALPAAPGPTRVAPVATFLLGRLRHASVVFVVSDFLTDESLPHLADLRLLTAAHDVVAVVVQDAAERRLFDAGGDVRVRDPETGARRRLAITGRVKRRVQAAMDERRRRLTDAFYDAGLDHAFLMDAPAAADGNGEEPAVVSTVLEPLLELFSARRRAS